MLHLKKVESLTVLIQPDGTLDISQGRQQVVITPDQCKTLIDFMQKNLEDQLRAWATSEMQIISREGFEV